MPDYLIRAALDLKAKKVMTVHHSKYALAYHRWDEPLRNEMNMAKNDSLHVLIPVIGEVVSGGNSSLQVKVFSKSVYIVFQSLPARVGQLA